MVGYSDTTPPSKCLRAGLPSPRRQERELIPLQAYPRNILIQGPEEEPADASKSRASSESDPHVKSASFLDRVTSTWNSWCERYRQPSVSDVDYGTPDEHAVPIRRPARRPAAKGEMVVPKGPTRQNSIFPPKSVSTGADRPFRKWRFDLTSRYNTSGETDVEPRRKKQKTASAMSDSDDEILYASGRQPLTSRSAKSVSSSIPPYDPTPRRLGGESEFLTLEKMVSGSRAVENAVNSRPRQMNSRPQRRSEEQDRDSPVDSSRANPITIDDDDDKDEIQDSGPEIGRPYLGTANRVRSRTAEEKNEMANRGARKQTRTHSQHFSGDESKVCFPNALGSSNGMNILRKRGRKDSFPARQGHLDPDAIEGISDDEEIKYEETSKSKGKQGKTIMSEFRKKAISDSISTGGDIPASYPGSPQRIGNGNTGSSNSETPGFPIEYIRSSSDKWEHKDGADQWYFQYNPRHSTFDIMASGEDASKICDSFVIKPRSIQKVKYGEKNGKIILYKPADTTKQGSNRLLIRLDKNRCGRFIQSLQNYALDVTVKVENDVKMDRIFEHTEDEFDNIRQPSKRADGVPEDIILLRRRGALRHAEQEQSERGNAGPARGNLKAERLNGSKVAPRSQRLSNRMRKDDSSTGPSKLSHSDDEERLKKFKNPATITRLTRSQNRGVRRSPTPPPVYWTDQNPGWESKYWKGDALIFPLDGKKQTPVDRCDIKRLDEGEFLNDNLISFYLRYLEDKAERERPDIAKRVHIMSPFFYQRLTRGKGRKNIDYDGVKRWTSKVNIFAYDYIVVPVNENQHWYLAIICNAPKLIESPKEQTVEEEHQAQVDEKDIIDLGDSQVEVVLPAKTPRDMVDDHKSPDIENNVSNLSIEDDPNEWPSVEECGGLHHKPSTFSKARTGMVDNQTPGKGLAATEDNDLPQETPPNSAKSKKGRRKSHPPVRKYNTKEPRIITLDSLDHAHSPTCSNLKEFLICEAKEKLGVEVTLAQHSIGMTAKNIPLQDNYCDCGLYLLGYVEGFLDNPDETIHDIMQSNDTTKHFVKMNASDMRNSMRDLIFKLRREQREKEIADLKAKKATKEAKKNEPSSSQLQRSGVSSASASPKPVSSSRNELEIPASSATATAEVEEEPIVCEVQAPKPAEAREETSEETSLPGDDVLNIVMDDLSGYDKQMEPSETDAGEAKPGVYIPLGNGPEYAARNAINESTSPVVERRASQKPKPSPQVKTPRSTKGHFDIKTEGRKPKYASQEPSPQRADDEGVMIHVKTFRGPRGEVGTDPSSQDSLLDAMSPGKRRAAKKTKLAREIPDSQTDSQQQQDADFEDIMDSADGGMEMQRALTPQRHPEASARSPVSWRVASTSPKHPRASAKSPITSQMKLGGASSMFKSPRGQWDGRQKMERRGEETPIIVD